MAKLTKEQYQMTKEEMRGGSAGQKAYSERIARLRAEADKPTTTIPTGKEAVGKQVTIDGQLYPSQEWYDVNIAKKKKTTSTTPTTPQPTGEVTGKSYINKA